MQFRLIVKPRKSYWFLRMLMRLLLIEMLISLILFSTTSHDIGGLSIFFGWCLGSGTLLLIGVVFLFVGNTLGNQIAGSAKIAFAPEPSFAEVHKALAQQYDRDPTIQEVSAAFDIITHQKNEERFKLGALATVFFVGHELNRR